MSSKLVKRRLDEFEKRCGKEALHLASHAALPVALNPELLHFLRINFFSDSLKQLPYTVEIEFFTSGFCREIDTELYEIEPDIRNQLLKKLQDSNEYGLKRIREIASLLWEYVKYHSPWEDRVELERAQQLTALHFLNREKAQQWLEQAQLKQHEGNTQKEWFVAMRQEIEQLCESFNPVPPFPTDFQFDAYLCHNSKDKPEVKEIEKQLQALGIRTFLDVSQILGGDSWVVKIVEAISESKTAVIFLGSNGLGIYQKKEINRFEGKHFRTDFKVIPVLLKDSPAPENLDLPSDFQWIIDELHFVDLRSGKDPQAMEKLIKAIRGTNIPPNIPQPEDDLRSDKGVDYTRLRDLLKKGNWEEADEQTLTVMIEAAGRQKEGWLDSDSIKKFPYTDLRTIDKLWVKYSNGHFGFSVQKHIWESVGKNHDKFGDRVGWLEVQERNKEKGQWADYSNILFSINAPEGHLPTRLFRRSVRSLFGLVPSFLLESLLSLLSRPDL